MFGTNNSNKNAMKQDNSGQPNVNMISSGTKLTGSLHTKNDIRISGTIDGEIHAENKCILSDSGSITGDLRTKEADIAGTINGELIVSNRLTLRATAKITGDITTKVLMVEEGARIDGACRMNDEIDLNQPDSAKKEKATNKEKVTNNDSQKQKPESV